MKNNKPTGGYDRLKAKQAELEAKYAELENRYNEEVAEHQALETMYTELTESMQNLQSAKTRIREKLEEVREAAKKEAASLQQGLHKRTCEVNELLHENKELECKIKYRDERIEGQERRLLAYWQHMGWFRRWSWSRTHHED